MFKKGDEVYVLLDASDEAVDYTRGDIRGQVFTVIDVDRDTNLDVLINFDGGWWVNSSALSREKGDTGKTAVERKIAFMNNRWEKRHV